MELLNELNIPDCGKQRIPVKTLVEQLNPTLENKKVVESHIASMYLVSVLDQNTIRIRPYKDEEVTYQTIYVFEINLKKDDSLMALVEQVHSAFPEPTVLLLKGNNKIHISVAKKRLNKVNLNNSILLENVLAELNDKNICYLDFKQIGGNTLKDYYYHLIDDVYKIKVFNITDVYPKKDMDFNNVIKKYEELKANINKLKIEYKQASMKSEKIRIDDDLFDVEEELKTLVKDLR